jgi:hypothetical protein
MARKLVYRIAGSRIIAIICGVEETAKERSGI